MNNMKSYLSEQEVQANIKLANSPEGQKFGTRMELLEALVSKKKPGLLRRIRNFIRKII